jgi:hypothetical protein
VLALIIWRPWSQRQLALAFLVFPALSPKTSHKLGKGHRTVIKMNSMKKRNKLAGGK